MIKGDMIQFEGSKGQIITTPVNGLTLIRGKGDYKAYFGTGGQASLTQNEYEAINSQLGMPVPAPVTPVDDDADDGNLTTSV